MCDEALIMRNVKNRWLFGMMRVVGTKEGKNTSTIEGGKEVEVAVKHEESRRVRREAGYRWV